MHRFVYNAIMAAMRQSWTDERLDEGFDRVDADLRAIRNEVSYFRVETNGRFDRIEDRVDGLEGRFDRVEDRFDRFDDRFDRWQRIMFSMLGGLIVALLGIVLTHM
jgi:hypothetical protein